MQAEEDSATQGVAKDRPRQRNERKNKEREPPSPSCPPSRVAPGNQQNNLQGWMPRTLDIYRLPGLFKAS